MNDWDALAQVREHIAGLLDQIKAARRRESELVQSCQRWLKSGPVEMVSPSRAEAIVAEAILADRKLTNKQLAAKLHLSERTIKWHLSHLMEKYGVENRHELVRALDSRPEPEIISHVERSVHF